LAINTYRIEVFPIVSSNNTQNKWVKTAHQLNVPELTGCLAARVFFLQGTLADTDARKIAQELLTDPVTERYILGSETPPEACHTVDVALHPGVTDPQAESLLQAAHRLGIEALERAATGTRFVLYGDLSHAQVQLLSERMFSNPVIEDYCINTPITPPFVVTVPGDGYVETIPLRDASDEELLNISKLRRLSLDLSEMHAIQTYYQQEQRDPSDVELETLAQTWSEHCVHKTFKALIDFTGPDGTTTTIDGILNTYIRAATEKVDKPWVVSAFVDNAGIIRFDEQFDIAFKVETHNHPSALEPFGGANTGVGGVVRDVLGVSARPIANTDVLCFGPQDLPEEKLLPGLLHPRRIQSGVVHGIEDYGNKMGIPTVNGAVLYGEGYVANPLVFCGCLGILPRGSHRTEAQAGDLIVVLGGRTGRDGLRGATFSSMEMDTSTSDIASVSVQIGHPINEKQLQEVIIRARDAMLYSAITDCGAGGLSSAVGEMGEKIGAVVELSQVPLKYAGLRPWEIWLSEAQERMVMAVPLHNWETLEAIARDHNVEATIIGSFEPTNNLTLTYNGKIVGSLSMQFLHDGIPQRQLKATWKLNLNEISVTPSEHKSVRNTLLELLAHPNIRSKDSIIRRYDHEVQGGTVIKPLIGSDGVGHNNGAVLVPIDTRHHTEPDGTLRGIALSAGICPQYGDDPYAMAWAAIDEAFRNLVAIGADPDQVALLDNFCWGNPNLPDRLGTLVLAAQGCHDAAVTYNAPYISGKDSLNNEYADADGKRHAIPGTLLISAVGIVPDVRKSVTSDLKKAGNRLYVVGGPTKDEFGGSHYNLVNRLTGGKLPQPNPQALQIMRTLHQAIREGCVIACHDISEGGLAVALAEMCIGGKLGAELIDQDSQSMDTASADIRQRKMLFSESLSRFIVEVPPEKANAFEELLTGVPHGYVGDVMAKQVLKLPGFGSPDLEIEIPLPDMESAWRSSSSTTSPPMPPTSQRRDWMDQTAQMHRMNPTSGIKRVCILHAIGTNRDHDAALACELAGGKPEIVTLNQLMAGERNLSDYHMLVIPGGFSYGDDLGAGQLWAQVLKHDLRDALERFVVDGRPVLGICNGFQTLVKAGLLPDADFTTGSERKVTLTYNESGQFECRWVYLKKHPNSLSLFTAEMHELVHCPAAHGEGRVVARDAATLEKLWHNGQVALTYVDSNGDAVGYPGNPNGSDWGIAGLTNGQGNVMGLMPHPENHIFPWQHPQYHRGNSGQLGLILFQNGLKFA